jgi:hypothetical protein
MLFHFIDALIKKRCVCSPVGRQKLIFLLCFKWKYLAAATSILMSFVFHHRERVSLFLSLSLSLEPVASRRASAQIRSEEGCARGRSVCLLPGQHLISFFEPSAHFSSSSATAARRQKPLLARSLALLLPTLSFDVCSLYFTP